MPEETDTRTDLEGILSQYVSICNRIMAEHSDERWFRAGQGLNRAVLGETTLHTIVYDEHPDRVLGEFILHFDPETEELSLLPAGAREVSFTWKVPLTYLEDVVHERPGWYLEHPLMLDGMWVTERARDEVRANRGPLVAALAGLFIGAAIGAASAWYLASDR
jgi:hypothetical protein